MEKLRLRQRGRTSLEVKLRYILGPRNRHRSERYTFQVDLYLPQSLNINPDTHDPVTLLEQRKLYVRFDTPRLSLSSLLSSDNPESPLTRTEAMAAAAAAGTPIAHDDLLYETKMLGAVYKSILRDLVAHRHQAPEAGQVHFATPALEVCRRFHALTRRMGDITVQRRIVDHTRLIDEHLSMLLEHYLSKVMFWGDADIEAAIREEAGYRETVGYPTGLMVTPSTARREAYVHREKLLKSYAAEVLFFRVKSTDQRKRLQHVLYAIAAGLSMAIATGIAFYGQSTFGNITTSLFVLLVASYMLKDRIKDVFRDMFMRSAGRFFFDRKERLFDTVHRRKLAVVRERSVYLDRHQQSRAGTVIMGADGTSPRVCLQYTKRVTIRAAVMNRIHNRVHGVADILVLEMGPLLTAAARLFATTVVQGADGSLAPKKVRRVHYIDMVMRYQDSESAQETLIRLVVANGSIRRIEYPGQE